MRYRWLWWASCASPSWAESCDWEKLFTVAAGDLSKLAYCSASWHGKERISAQSHHKTTCAFLFPSYWGKSSGGIWCCPSFWMAQLLSNHSREQKKGNVCERQRKREKKVRAKQINLPYLTIRCQYVAGAELGKWSIVWHQFKVTRDKKNNQTDGHFWWELTKEDMRTRFNKPQLMEPLGQAVKWCKHIQLNSINLLLEYGFTF